jgi:hypothetical protein
MGTLTRAELQSEVSKNLGGLLDNLSGADLTAAKERINRHLELTQIRMARVRDFQELRKRDSDPVTITGTPATDQYYTNLPSTLRKVFAFIRQIGTDRGHKLTFWPHRSWDQLVTTPSEISTGDADIYTAWRDSSRAIQMELYPVPSQNWTLLRRYSVWPTPFANDNAVSDFDAKDDIIIAWTTEWMFRSMGETEDHNEWRGVRMELLDTARKDDMSEPDISILPRGQSVDVEFGPNYWVDPFVRRAP